MEDSEDFIVQLIELSFQYIQLSLIINAAAVLMILLCLCVCGQGCCCTVMSFLTCTTKLGRMTVLATIYFHYIE